MSESGTSAVDRGDDSEECPLCLAPLPPFWDMNNRMVAFCCGGYLCRGCEDKRRQYLKRADAQGTFGREEIQLQSKCSLCRTQLPMHDGEASNMMLSALKKGRLALSLYHMLGNFYMGGNGVEQNGEKAVEVWTLGAEKGDPDCQFILGVTYQEGNGGREKSSEVAKSWYLAATEQGHAIAEHKLANMLGEDGKDVECLRYLRGSASKGYDGACHDLGQAHYLGKYGLQRSVEEAIRVVTPAAERGCVASMFALGYYPLCQPDGLGKLKTWDNPNFTRGMHWIRRAVGAGHSGAVKCLKGIEDWTSSKCFMCYADAPPEETFLRCSRCRAAWYCSKDCQVRHWTSDWFGHKQVCIKWHPQK